MGLPIDQKLVKSGSTWARLWRTHFSETAGWIYTIWSFMALPRPVVVQHHGHLTLTLDFQGQILKMLYLRNGNPLHLSKLLLFFWLIHYCSLCFYFSVFIPFYPSALRAGGVLSSRSGRAGGRAGGLAVGRAVGRSGGRLPDLRNPYLCNRLMDFLRSKFYGIV